LNISNDAKLEILRPILLDISPNEATTSYLYCPLRMQMVIWMTQGYGKVRLVDHRFAQYWNSYTGQDCNGWNCLHGLRQWSGEPDNLCITKQKGRNIQNTLQIGDYLFVPRHFAISIQSDEPANLRAACFVDASNLQDFLSAAYSTIEMENTVPNSPAQQLSALSIDPSMARDVTELTLTDYLDYKPSLEKEIVADKKDEDSNKPKRRKRRGGEHKAWQDRVAWDSLILRNTIPAPGYFLSIQPQRDSVVLTLHEDNISWLTGEGRASAEGFRVTICKLNSSVTLYNDFLVSISSDDNEKVELIPPSWLAESCVVKDFSKNQIGQHELDSNRFQLSLTVSTLEPGEYYQFRVQRFYDTTVGPSNPWSVRTRCLQLTPPHRLSLALKSRSVEIEPIWKISNPFSTKYFNDESSNPISSVLIMSAKMHLHGPIGKYLSIVEAFVVYRFIMLSLVM
jgi:hypothetical protein